MAERYKPETEEQRKAFMLGEIVSTVHFLTDNYGKYVEMVYERDAETTCYVRFSYPNEDESSVKITLDKQWYNADPDSYEDFREIVNFFIEGNKIRKEGLVDKSYFDGAGYSFHQDPRRQVWIGVALFPRDPEYNSPEVTMKDVKILRDVVVNGNVERIGGLDFPFRWPKVLPNS